MMFEKYWEDYHANMRIDMKSGYFRLLEKSINAGDITEDFFEYLSELPAETIDEQETAYKELAKSIIQTRLIKGAAYIERVDITEAQREKGMKLYNSLCAELEGMK